MRNLLKNLSSEKGLTLIEIMASITILSIIIVSLLTMFAQSSRTNKVSKNMMDATYVAENTMEEMNKIITSTVSLDKLNLPSTRYQGSNTFYEKIQDTNGHYVTIVLEPTNPFIKVKVYVYTDKVTKKLEAQMEMLLSWKQS